MYSLSVTGNGPKRLKLCQELLTTIILSTMSSPKDYLPGSEGVIDRRMVFCETLLSKLDTSELLGQYTNCLRFCAFCCQHKSSECHHFALAFTDGSCLNNGKSEATA